jgi:hypothetical protein
MAAEKNRLADTGKLLIHEFQELRPQDQHGT